MQKDPHMRLKRFVDALSIAAAAFLAASVIGCGKSKSPSAPSDKDKQTHAPSDQPSIRSKSLASKTPTPTDPATPSVTPSAQPNVTEDQVASPDTNPAPPNRGDGRRRPKRNVSMPAKMPIDETRVAAREIRKLTSRHLTLYTDLPSSPDVEELPRVFDLAVPQWCAYFDFDPAVAADWHMTSFIIDDRSRFEAAGLMPENLPDFHFGYQRGHEFWVYEQSADGQPAVYFRRQLMLHEGTHAFMDWHLGGLGPVWYAEGMAELLGTHRWQDGELTLRHFPQSREETPFWGRIKVLRDAWDEGQAQPLISVLQQRAMGRQLDTEVYAWSWAAATFFDSHPDYREAFVRLRDEAGDNTELFTRILVDDLKSQWNSVAEQWQLFLSELDYGYDFERALVEIQPGQPLPAGGATVTIVADRGWQSTGVRLDAGRIYSITATGRYQIDDEPQVWWCEPNGVTIHYHRGLPLGMLLGAIRGDDPLPDGVSPLAQPGAIGLQREITPPQSGTLYCRINESLATLADNAGKVTIRIDAK